MLEPGFGYADVHTPGTGKQRYGLRLHDTVLEDKPLSAVRLEKFKGLPAMLCTTLCILSTVSFS